MEDKVLEFIHRRFPEDCHWTDGNCYWFAKILEESFDLTLCYEPINGHFIAYDYDERCWYDWKGRHDENVGCVPFTVLKVIDPKWYDRLVRDCVN